MGSGPARLLALHAEAQQVKYLARDYVQRKTNRASTASREPLSISYKSAITVFEAKLTGTSRSPKAC